MRFRTHILPPVVAALAVVATSCHTGVDSTDRIEITRKERRLMKISEADTLLNDAVGDSLSQWKTGRPFLAVSDRTAFIFDASTTAANPSALGLGGKTLTFCRMGSKTAPDGQVRATIIFSDGKSDYVYDTGRSATDAKSIRADRLPLLVDLISVGRADSILRMRQLWILTPDRYAPDGTVRHERKFSKITVDSVTPGTDALPFSIWFTTDKGARYVLTGLPPATAHTRTFPSLFAMSDPRNDYQHIYPDVWENICNGKVATGMTKEECRLALGSPADIDRARNWSVLSERWSYPGGVVLIFDDGRLVNFRN